MPDLFAYLDYRAYLRDLYEEKKKQNAFFSYRYLGSKAGIDAGNLVKVLQGERHLSPKAVAGIAAYLKLTSRESRYFDLLVKFAKAKQDKKNRELFEQLVRLRTVEPDKVGVHQYEFYRKWYYTAILAHLSFMEFRGDYRALAESLDPPVSVKEAKESVALLLRLGFVKQKPDGSLELANHLISTGEKWQSVAIRGFQEETLRLAQRSLERQRQSIRDISTLTISIAASDLEEIKRLGKEYRKRVLEIANDCERPDRVYQVNTQVFPMSAIKGAGDAHR